MKPQTCHTPRRNHNHPPRPGQHIPPTPLVAAAQMQPTLSRSPRPAHPPTLSPLLPPAVDLEALGPATGRPKRELRRLPRPKPKGSVVRAGPELAIAANDRRGLPGPTPTALASRRSSVSYSLRSTWSGLLGPCQVRDGAVGPEGAGKAGSLVPCVWGVELSGLYWCCV